MAVTREVKEGIQLQGVDEIIAYTITTTNWGSTPTSPSVVVKDTSDSNTDVTSTVMNPNSPSVAGDVITLSALDTLTVDHVYRVEVKFVTGGNTLECFFLVKAEL